MPNKYTGTTDGIAKGKREGTEKLVELCKKRYGFTNLGTWVVREIRGKAGQLSVHATGRAADIGYSPKQRAEAVKAFEWFTSPEVVKALHIEEVHDYSFGKFGRGFRCVRKVGQPLVKVYQNEEESAGSIGGKWLHIEISPVMADDAEAFEKAWRALPKPA